MLPTKNLVLNYEDINYILEKNLYKVHDYQIKNKINFDFIVAKLKNALIPATMLSNKLNLEVYSLKPKEDYSNFELLIPKDYIFNKIYNVLLIINVVYDEIKIKKIKNFFKVNYPNINLHIFSLFGIQKYGVNIIGIEENVFFKTPWEVKTLNPDAILDRLLNDKLTSTYDNKNYIGISSEDCFLLIEDFILKKIENKIIFKDNQNIISSSNVSTLKLNENLTIQDYKEKYSKIINNKLEFIIKNNLTHFIENNIYQAVLLSELNTLCDILYFDNKNFHKVKSFELKKIDVKNIFDY